MALDLNKVILAGRMVADPELKQTATGVPVIQFRMAVSRRFKAGDGQHQTEADFFNVTAWRGTAEFVSKYFSKGSAICVCGSIQNRSWTDNKGGKHYATDIVADEAHFVESKAAQAADPVPFAPAVTVDQMAVNDGDLPF